MGVSCILVLALKDQGWSCIDWEREKMQRHSDQKFRYPICFGRVFVERGIKDLVFKYRYNFGFRIR